MTISSEGEVVVLGTDRQDLSAHPDQPMSIPIDRKSVV